MPIKMIVNKPEPEEKEDKFSRAILSRGDKFGKLSPLKLGLSAGLGLAVLILAISITASFGIFEKLSSTIFEFYDLDASLGFLGIILAMVYTFLQVFVAVTLIALIYDYFV